MRGKLFAKSFPRTPFKNFPEVFESYSDIVYEI